ncbi:MAG: preprotein translocase subunit SecY [Candidatus Bathyarchaeota archaeon]|jgi:preprotein translocase SecY subunit
MGAFLNLFKPISRFIPEVKPPERKVSFNTRIMWTALALIVYLIMAETPLYGVSSGQQSDALFTMRVIFASQRGTLLELGIGPIVTAGLIIQLLAGSEIIDFDNTNPEHRALFTTASKVFSFMMVILQASLMIISGTYGSIGFGTSLLVFGQLLAAGLFIMLLDELVQKGWGIGSGISLFIVAGITKTIWWSSFALYTVGDGKRYGAIPAFFETVFRGESVWNWLHRTGGFPDMLGLLTTIAIFAFVIYVEGMRVELPISHSLYRGFRGKMPIKLLYVSNIPVILAYALFANFQLAGQLIWSRFNADNANKILNLYGTYNATSGAPTGGFVYYLSSPGNIDAVIADPVRALLYTIIVVGICVIFSLTWLEIGGLGAENMADQLLGSGMQIPGFRRSRRPIVNFLNRYIPTITVISGLIVGLLAAASEFFGVFGSGMGALLCVSILYQYYQTMVQEQVEDLYPFLRDAFR